MSSSRPSSQEDPVKRFSGESQSSPRPHSQGAFSNSISNNIGGAGGLARPQSAMQSLEDFRRKLDAEHESIRTRLQEGAQIRQELTMHKVKLQEDLDRGQEEIETQMQITESKLIVAKKVKTMKEDMVSYLEEQLEEARGTVEACDKALHRHKDFKSKLELEQQEIAAKLSAEAERIEQMKSSVQQQEDTAKANEEEFKDEMHRLGGQLKAEEQVAAAFKDYADSLKDEMDAVKRKFTVESKFESKQENVRAKLESDLEAVQSKLEQEKSTKAEMLGHREKLNNVLKESEGRLQDEAAAIRVQQDAERRLQRKLDAFLKQMQHRLEGCKGALIAAGDVKSHVEGYIATLTARRKELAANEAKNALEAAELEKMKVQITKELTEIEDLFEGELAEASGKQDTCEVLISHNKRYLDRLEQQLHTTSARLATEGGSSVAELQELQARLGEEADMVKARIQSEEATLSKIKDHQKQLEVERDGKVAALKGDIIALDERINAEQSAQEDWAAQQGEIEGEEGILLQKLEGNKAAVAELRMTRERLQQLVQDLRHQKTTSEQTSESLVQEGERLAEELERVRDKINKEIEDLDFRISVQTKSIAGLEGFERKIVSDLEYVRDKLAAIRHVKEELDETLQRLGAMMDAANARLDVQRTQVSRLKTDRREKQERRSTQRDEEQDEIEALRTQLMSEEKLRAGVQEYERRLEHDMIVVSRKIQAETSKVKAAESYSAKVAAEANDYREGADAASSAITELNNHLKTLEAKRDDMVEKYGGDLEEVAERLEVDVRASAGLEGYRQNLGDELDIVRKKLSSRKSGLVAE